MAFSITQFQNNTQNQLSALDNNFTTFGALAPIPCAIAGTNTLTLTQNAAGILPTVAITAYSNGMLFTGVAVATNTGAVTAAVGAAPSLNVYKDTGVGPVALSGQEIVVKNAISLRYDSSLNSGAGGFHLTSSTVIANTPINPTSIQINSGATLTNMLSGSVSLSIAAVASNSSADTLFSLSGAAAVIPVVGDFITVIPPSSVAIGLTWLGMVLATGSLTSTTSQSTVAVRMANCENVNETPPSGFYKWRSMRFVP